MRFAAVYPAKRLSTIALLVNLRKLTDGIGAMLHPYSRWLPIRELI
jgi:hypothetical protein